MCLCFGLQVPLKGLSEANCSFSGGFMREKDPRENTPLIDKSFSFSVHENGNWKKENRDAANQLWQRCLWLAVTRPRLVSLDMGIYWRQPHQSAPHLIKWGWALHGSGGLHIQAAFAVLWLKLQQVSRRNVCFLDFLRTRDACPWRWGSCPRLCFRSVNRSGIQYANLFTPSATFR